MIVVAICRYERQSDVEACLLEMEVLYSEAEEFAAPHPRRGREQIARVETILGDGDEERSEIVGAPRPHLFPSWLGRVREVRRVPVEGSRLDGLFQRAPQDHVDVADRSRCQASDSISPAPDCEEVGVELIQSRAGETR
ncbi:MAG TPA: hypothetical protein VFF07_06170 [Actinomycetota bacterium]|nr:hypothetical protein [Actinomycetota bacterium]